MLTFVGDCTNIYGEENIFMSNTQLIEELEFLNVITASGQLNKQAKRLLSKATIVENKIIAATAFLTADNFNKPEHELRARILCVREDIVTTPVCGTCNKPVTFNHTKNQFNRFCPNNKSNCANQSSAVMQKKKDTTMERFGVENVAELPEVLDKRKKTNIKRYGTVAPAGNADVRDKIKQTKIERYGTDKWTDEQRQSKEDTMIERYGAKTFAESNLPPSVVTKLNDKGWLLERHYVDEMTPTEIAASINVTVTTVCRHIHNHKIPMKHYARASNTSKGEIEVAEYVKSITSCEVITNTKNVIPPYEVDIYIPEKKIGIEFCGIYYHSELRGRDRNYHNNKTKAANANDIHLIQLYDTEWNNKQDIVKGVLRSLIGESKVLYARKTSVQQLDNQQYREFLQSYHLQGHRNATYKYGLFDGAELVSIMSFGKSRYNKDVEYELLRYCVKPGVSVVGGANKLFKQFIADSQSESVISYSDRRWFSGEVYKSMGFEFKHNSSPGYSYFNTNDATQLMSRQQFQKHKLQLLLETFNPEHTEWQNMADNGYDRVWDCGNSVWLWAPTI
jgi:hypothetical protein